MGMAMEKNNKRLLETDIKAIVLNHLRANDLITDTTSIINEFTVGNFSRRVDLAVTNEKHLIAYEIKSEADSLYRLTGQTAKYLEYFDKVIIVAASKHIKNVIETVPKHVGVWEILDGKVVIKQRGKIVTIKNKTSLIELMKANELLKLSNKLRLSPVSKNRKSLEKELLKASVAALREASLRFVTGRFSNTSSLFLKKTEGRLVLSEDIDFLSPYRKERNTITALNNEKEALWRAWEKCLEDQHLIMMSQTTRKQFFGVVPLEIRNLITA